MNKQMQPAETLSMEDVAAVLAPRLRPKKAWEFIGVKKSTFYALQKEGSEQFDPTFPTAIRVAPRTRVWEAKALMDWLRSRADQKHSQTSEKGGAQ